MRTLSTAAAILLLATATASAQDPTRTDGDKYKLKFENDKVRVLEYSDQPSEITHQHRHPALCPRHARTCAQNLIRETTNHWLRRRRLDIPQ